MAIQIPKTEESSALKKEMLGMAFSILKERNNQISSNNYFKVEKFDKKDEVVALSKQDLNPEITRKVMNKMKELNTNIKFSISSFNNNGIEKLSNFLLKKCENTDDQ